MKMKNVNRALLVGNLGADPERRTDAKGRLWAQASLATPGPGEGPVWHRLVAFGRAAEALAGFRKGEKIAVSGYLRKRTWEDEEGRVLARVEVLVVGVEATRAAPENRVILVGHLARDARFGVVLAADGPWRFVADLVVATNRAWKRAEGWVEEVTYHDVRVPEPWADAFRGLGKGTAVGVEGPVIYPGPGEAVVLAEDARVISRDPAPAQQEAEAADHCRAHAQAAVGG